ncbi:hypothetical protein AAG570_014149 [Ranatra chinensis]|uniref:Uncharacterized protein n=1 Tax=Ranatra chinensis TaxID=642074 RepID=A0ABD0XUI9_9HEMI
MTSTGLLLLYSWFYANRTSFLHLLLAVTIQKNSNILFLQNLNRLLSWGLGSVEGGLALLVDKTLAEVPMARKSLSLVDRILFKSLEQIEQRIPAVTYPPELLLNMTKDYLSVSVVRPVVKRADCVKKSGLSEASRYRELAASKLDTALDAADRYIDRYLPEPPADINNQPETEGESKTAHALEHANRLSKKLKRRLTNRTIAEAKALRQHGIDTINTLLYLADLMVRDPRLFAEKMRQVWANLSDDEPENQLPPANLDQLVAMFVREAARRMVHLTNFSFHFVSRLPTYSATVIQFSADLLVLGPYCAANLFGYLIKVLAQYLKHTIFFIHFHIKCRIVLTGLFRR